MEKYRRARRPVGRRFPSLLGLIVALSLTAAGCVIYFDDFGRYGVFTALVEYRIDRATGAVAGPFVWHRSADPTAAYHGYAVEGDLTVTAGAAAALVNIDTIRLVRGENGAVSQEWVYASGRTPIRRAGAETSVGAVLGWGSRGFWSADAASLTVVDESGTTAKRLAAPAWTVEAETPLGPIVNPPGVAGRTFAALRPLADGYLVLATADDLGLVVARLDGAFALRRYFFAPALAVGRTHLEGALCSVDGSDGVGIGVFDSYADDYAGAYAPAAAALAPGAVLHSLGAGPWPRQRQVGADRIVIISGFRSERSATDLTLSAGLPTAADYLPLPGYDPATASLEYAGADGLLTVGPLNRSAYSQYAGITATYYAAPGFGSTRTYSFRPQALPDWPLRSVSAKVVAADATAGEIVLLVEIAN
jgi:hypothetical protein